MRTKFVWGYFLLTIFLITHLHADDSLFQRDQEKINSDYIQALASLVFHTQESEEMLLSRNSSSEELPFSLEEVNLLWDKVRQNLDRFYTNRDLIQHEYCLEEAYQHYEQAKHLVHAGLQQEAQETMGSSSSLLNQLWEEAIELEKSSAIEYPLVLRKQIDPNVNNNSYLTSSIKKQMEHYLLPLHHEMRPVLDSLFLSTRVTMNKETFHQAGFRTIAKRPRSYIRVARHPKMPGYLVKVYLDTVLKEKQHKPSWRWLVLRCEGAAKVRYIIQKQHLKHFVVADKWIYCLPSEPSPPIDLQHKRHLALLLVTDMELESEDRNYYAWYHYITKEHLNELYMIVSRAKGSSYRPDNIAYTKNGTFAFIDTEYPSRGPDYKSIRHYLNAEMCAYWDQLVKKGGH